MTTPADRRAAARLRNSQRTLLRRARQRHRYDRATSPSEQLDAACDALRASVKGHPMLQRRIARQLMAMAEDQRLESVS